MKTVELAALAACLVPAAFAASCRAPHDPPATLDPALCDRLGARAAAGKPLAGEEGLRSDATEWARLSLRRVYECAAVFTDSDAPCEEVPRDEVEQCRIRRRFFHGARTARTKNDWTTLMGVALSEMCAKVGMGNKEQCGRLMAPVRDQDPKQCAGTPMPGAWCVALATADPARCEGDRDCIKDATRIKVLLAGDLEALAKDGPEQDTDCAAAALGRPGACDLEVAKFKNVCVGGGSRR